MAISQNFPNTRPSLNLNFARSKTLDPRITFSRTSAGTYVDDNGFIKTASADEPRFDHDHTTGESLGLLVEEARSNYYHRWNPTTDTATHINSSHIDTQTTSSLQTPLGVTATAYTATKTGNSGQYHGLNGGSNYINITSDTSVSFSAYLKEFNSSDYRLYFVISAYNVSTNNRRYLLYRARPSNGTWASGSVDSNWSTPTLNIKDCGNGWYRYEITSTNTYESGWDIIETSFQLLNESNAQFYDPPTANTHGLYLSAPQVEVGAFPTSYIPIVSTNTTARTADSVSITGTNFSDWFNQDEGTVYADMGPYVSTDTGNFGISIGSASNNYLAFPYITSDGTYSRDVYWRDPTVAETINFSSGSTAGKYAIAYKNSERLTGYFNGTLGEDTVGAWPNPSGYNSLRIGTSHFASGQRQNFYLKQFTYYPSALSNAILQTLTK